MACDRKIGPYPCCSVVQGDCLELMKQLPDGCVDAVITDPPYSEHVHANAMRGTRNENGAIYGESKDFAFGALRDVCLQQFGANCGRLVRRWTLVFSDIERVPSVRESLAPLEYIRTGAWVKIAPCPQFTGDRPAAGFEAITIAHPKGRKRWNGGGAAAVYTYCAHGGEKDVRLHPAQKPLDLMLELLGLYSDAHETILDPFCGSGTTLVAAKKLGRHYLGFEISEEYCRIARDRIARVEAQPNLFEKKPEQLTMDIPTSRD